jgi:8-oxo-dGTP pyrophosphatase MutT (NUDIX family)
MDELIDIVDEQNNVLYTVGKHEAHQKGLAHRTVLSTIFDSKGNWILVRQAAHKQDAGQLVSPIGGHVSAGETEEQAVRREALEEAGIRNIQRLHEIARLPFDRKILGRHEVHRFTVYEIYSDDPIVLNDESDGYRIFTEEELKRELHEHPEAFGITFHISVDTYYPHLRS